MCYIDTGCLLCTFWGCKNMWLNSLWSWIVGVMFLCVGEVCVRADGLAAVAVWGKRRVGVYTL
jgi:hypothetical protein